MHIIYKDFGASVKALNETLTSDRQTLISGAGRAYKKNGLPFVSRPHAASVGEGNHTQHLNTFERISKNGTQFSRDQVYLGFAGFLNLSYIGKIKPAAVIFADNNAAQAVLWSLVIDALKAHETPKGFLEAIPSIEEALSQNLKSLFLKTKGVRDYEQDLGFVGNEFSVFRRMGFLKNWLSLDSLEKAEYSDDELWLEEESYAHLHSLAKNNAIAPLTFDVLDQEAVQQLNSFMQHVKYQRVSTLDNTPNYGDKKGACFGTFYLSNVLETFKGGKYDWVSYDVQNTLESQHNIAVHNLKQLVSSRGVDIIDDLKSLRPKDPFEEIASFSPDNSTRILPNIKKVFNALNACAYKKIPSKKDDFPFRNEKVIDYDKAQVHAVKTSAGRAYLSEQHLPVLQIQRPHIFSKLPAEFSELSIQKDFELSKSYASLYMGSGGLEELGRIAHAKSPGAILFNRNLAQTLFWQVICDGLQNMETPQEFFDFIMNESASSLQSKIENIVDVKFGESLLNLCLFGAKEVQNKIERARNSIHKMLFDRKFDYSHLRKLAKHDALTSITLDLIDTKAIIALEEALENFTGKIKHFYQDLDGTQKIYQSRREMSAAKLGYINVENQLLLKRKFNDGVLTKNSVDGDVRDEDNKRFKNLSRLSHITSGHIRLACVDGHYYEANSIEINMK